MKGARDFASPVRGIDCGFIARQRAKGTPEAAIARMGGWCVADVQAVPQDYPHLYAATRPPPIPSVTPRLCAEHIPEVSEILRHIAEQYLVTVEDLLGEAHDQYYVEPRHEAFAVVWELNRYTLAELGEIFNKTSNGIIYGLKRHYERLRVRGPGRDW